MVSVIAVFGPTASGKTAVAEEVADRVGTEVVSCDAMQVYRGLPILTNQPSRPTALVGIRELNEEMSVGAYATLAQAAIDELVARTGMAVVSGGTGLYLRAALADLDVPPPPEAGVRERVLAEVESDPAAAHARLARLDPRAAGAVHANDQRRLVRALELAETGASLAPADDRLWTEDTRLPTTIVALDLPLDVLDARIEERTQAMLEAGAPEEARRAWSQHLSPTARKVLGLEEFATLPADEAVAAVAQATRRLARYQRKWLRKMPGVVTLDADRSAEEIADDIVSLGRAGQPVPAHD